MISGIVNVDVIVQSCRLLANEKTDVIVIPWYGNPNLLVVPFETCVTHDPKA